jgi:ribosomal protein S18 acetylase RimI-like enzyme
MDEEITFESTSAITPNHSLVEFIREHLPSLVTSLETEGRADLRLQMYGVVKGEFCCVAKTKERLIGIGGIMKFLKLFPGLVVVVHSSYRGKGIADTLMSMIDDFAEKNCNYIILLFNISPTGQVNNEPAFNLYRKHGFKNLIRIGNILWIHRWFNKKGGIISKFLLPVLVAHYFATHFPCVKFIYYRVMRYRVAKAASVVTTSITSSHKEKES